MLKSLLSRVTGGDAGDKVLRRYVPLVDAINALEPAYEAFSDAELRVKTDEFRARIREHTAALTARVAEARRRLDVALGEEEAARRPALEDELKRRRRELFQAEAEILDEILVEAFAAVRESAKRTIGQRHFDVQLIGGAVLHSGKIAEMRTGEGKTLVATLPAYLNALLGHGVHVVTVNDYLARRDAAWMGPIYHKLGLTVGVLQGEGESFVFEPGFDKGTYAHLRPVRSRPVRYYTPKGEVVRQISDRGEAYRADITYGTNNEFGFDYLRDNLAYDVEDRVQRELFYAIVDEVDNIFIDEARTPLIISGFAEEDVEEYRRWAEIARKLEPGADYTVNEKERHVDLTTQGLARVESLAGITNIYDETNSQYVQHLEQALSAQALFLRDREYAVLKGRVVLIDEHTGRLMPDRRLSDGLHQAIEAKEHIAEIRPRMVTQATITIQNYFRMYPKRCGMTGTAKSEEEEFYKIYTLDVVVIPTNVEYMASRPESGLQEVRQRAEGTEIVTYVRRDARGGRGAAAEAKPVFFKRIDYPDSIYRTADAKWTAIVDEITRLHRAGRPVLVGTTSVEKSEKLGRMLRSAGIPHQILNAKYHAEEAAIIARAGELGAVTVATSMAGRGVDIRLGGELKEETIREAQAVLRRRGLDPFRVSDEQFYTAIAEVGPEYVRRRNQVLGLGGLHVLGTERHDARRIDNQLRGRSGRQGEPGSSRFYVSLEDDMMRVFGGDRIDGVMKWAMGGDDSIPLEHSAVTRALDMTQVRVEGHHFDMRKHVLEYDDVLNRQRELIYGQRLRVLSKDDVHEDVWQLIEEELDIRLGSGDRKGKAAKGVQSLEAFAWLDGVMPITPLPPVPAQSPEAEPRREFRLRLGVGTVSVLPPFSLWFTANRLEGESGLELSRTLTTLLERALDGYRDEIIARAIEGPLADFFEQDKTALAELANQLEEKAEEYILWQQEQEKPLQPRAFADHLKRVMPQLRGAPFAEIAATDAAQVRKDLAPYLERAHYRQAVSDLLNRTYQAAYEFRGDWAAPADIAEELYALAERAYASRESAGDGAGAAGDRAAKELERLLDDLQRLGEPNGRAGAGGRLAKMDVFEILAKIAGSGDLPLEPLGDLLRNVVTQSYDRWAARQRERIAERLDEIMANVREGTRDEVVQVLLDLLFISQDKDVQRPKTTAQQWQSLQPRFPLPYLTAVAAEDLSPDQLREAIHEVIEEAVEAREDIWGALEMARLRSLGVPLGALETPALESLARFWGRQLLARFADARVADLPADGLTALRTWLQLGDIEDQGITDLDDGEAMLEYIARKRVAEFSERWDRQDSLTRQDLENALRAQGAFEDPGAEADLLGRPVAAAKPAFVDGLAMRLGRAVLDPLRFAPLTELDLQVQQAVREVLLRRGAFNDEKRVQHFLVEQQLTDLGEPAARSAVAALAAERMRRLGVYRIEELDDQMRALWLEALRRSGSLTDARRNERLLSVPLAGLAPEEYTAAAQGVGRQILDGRERGRDLPPAAQQIALTGLARPSPAGDPGFFGPLPAQAFGPEAAAQARRALQAEAQAAMGTCPVGELPEWLRRFVLGYLEEREYFVDQARARALAAQRVGSLEPRVLAGLEEHLGLAIIGPLAEQKVQALDDELRETVLRFFDTRGLFRKKDQRQRLLATKVTDLHLLQKGLYKEITAHLGRERLNGVRNTPVGELPADLRAEVKHYLWQSDSIDDREKREVVAMLPVSALEDDVRSGLDAALDRELERLVAQVPVGELPPDTLRRVCEVLDTVPAVFDAELKARFADLVLADLPPAALDGLARTLGAAELALHGGQSLAALGAPDGEGLGRAAWAGLDAAGLLLDAGRQAALLGRRIEELALVEPAGHQAAVAAMADRLYNEAAGRRVAELDDDLRRDLRETLDRQQVFLDPQAVRNFENGRLADLRAPDYEAAVAAVGRLRLGELPDPQAALGAWPPDLRDAALEQARAQGLTLDSARLSAFRGRGPAALPDLPPQMLVDYAREGLRRSVETHTIAELGEDLRRHIETYLEEHGASAGQESLAPLRDRLLAELDPDLLAGLASIYGRRRVARLSDTPLSSVDAETAASLTEFIGQRMRQNVEKGLMLTHISRLWIDYLTEIENLRQGIGLQAFGQRDPLVEYKRRAFQLFDELRADIRRHVVGSLFHPNLAPPPIKVQS